MSAQTRPPSGIEQSAMSAEGTQAHPPWLQLSGASQAWPQAPQLSLSVCSFKQSRGLPAAAQLVKLR